MRTHIPFIYTYTYIIYITYTYITRCLSYSPPWIDKNCDDIHIFTGNRENAFCGNSIYTYLYICIYIYNFPFPRMVKQNYEKNHIYIPNQEKSIQLPWKESICITKSHPVLEHALAQDVVVQMSLGWLPRSHMETFLSHYNDVIMSAMASQISSIPIVCSTVGSGADQRKHQSSASLAFARGIHRSPVNSPHKGPVWRKMIPFDDVITVKYILSLSLLCLDILDSVNSLRPPDPHMRQYIKPSLVQMMA